MALINVTNLTFYYDGSTENIFDDVSFQVDTNWKLGLIGRNGRGKTTFLRLLGGRYEYIGQIHCPVPVDYFPYGMEGIDGTGNCMDVLEALCPGYELWKVCRELNLLGVDGDVLYRPYQTLSNGEQTKLQLALLFSQENHFLLIDEPTNHLDMRARQLVKEYLAGKRGYILVSHDRDFMDECVDHVLVLNRAKITVEQGNFSSRWENKQREDRNELERNENLKKDIRRLEQAARQARDWADRKEATKIGFDPVKEHDRFLDTRCYIAKKSLKMQQRRKNLESRQRKEIAEKEGLLKNIETADDLKLFPLTFHRNALVSMKDLGIYYKNDMNVIKNVINGLTLQLETGDRVALIGANGCGKSSLIRAVMSEQTDNMQVTGEMTVPAGLKISYVCQDTSALKGRLTEYADRYGIDNTLFRTVLRKLDFERTQFDKPMEEYSGGQKKKVLIARSLCEQAHLYIWDEPLNYIDIFSRMQIENLILEFGPTLLFVEHDKSFVDKIATRRVQLA